MFLRAHATLTCLLISTKRYADNLAESSQAYGQALVFYARAHATAKLKDTISLLTSLSLINSSAIPASSGLDPHLSSLLGRDRAGLIQLSRSDPEATKLLSSALSGYATLRKFYELRDQDVLPSGAIDNLKPMARKREAANALVAVIESAADCIRGGLFDPEIESAIPPEAILVLLGETLPLLSTDKRFFTKAHVFTLLRVVEDFATSPARIRERASELYRACWNAVDSGTGNGKQLQKSRSDLSNGSAGSRMTGSYDMLASSYMILSQDKGGSAPAQSARGWDWRKGLEAVGGVNADADVVLVMLRLALARQVGREWGVADGW
jgi:hypothetical protein